ncbi:MAG TPA: hypothetical protein VIE91_08955 [Methylophilaceae bacterium]
MKPSNNCKRVILAGKDGCRVMFCEDCNVAEVEVGALSLRLEVQAFTTLSEMLQEAAATASFTALKRQQNLRGMLGNVH